MKVQEYIFKGCGKLRLVGSTPDSKIRFSLTKIIFGIDAVCGLFFPDHFLL